MSNNRTLKHWLHSLIYTPPSSLHLFFLHSPLLFFSWLYLTPLLLFCFFLLLSSTHETGTSYPNTPPSPFFLSSLLLSYFLSFLICTPEGVVCLLTSWSKASAGLRLAPIIRAWQGAAVSTCQPNKHPLWHPPVCFLRGVSQPPSSGPLISWIAHSTYTSTRLLYSGQAAIVFAMHSHTYDTWAFHLVWDIVIEREAKREKEGENWKSLQYRSSMAALWAGEHLITDCLFKPLDKSFWNLCFASQGQ